MTNTKIYMESILYYPRLGKATLRIPLILIEDGMDIATVPDYYTIELRDNVPVFDNEYGGIKLSRQGWNHCKDKIKEVVIENGHDWNKYEADILREFNMIKDATLSKIELYRNGLNHLEKMAKINSII